MAKVVDKATIDHDRLLPYLRGDKDIPLPEGLKIWFGPHNEASYHNATMRRSSTPCSTQHVRALANGCESQSCSTGLVHQPGSLDW